MAQRIYCAYVLNGGTTGALDKIDGNDLSDKDMAIVLDQTNVYFFVLDADNGTEESDPDWQDNRVIAPDTNPGDKRWVLQSLYVEDISLVVDDLSVGDTVTIGGTTELKGAVQIGDADGTGANLTIYSDTAGDHIVFDKTAKTLTLTDIALSIDGSDIGAEVAVNTAHSAGDGSDHADVATNTVHISSDGSDHTFIDQDITSGSSPTFDMANMSGNPDINGGTIDGATIFSTITTKTGADISIVTGTAGESGDFVSWNADGDAVGSGVAPAEVGQLATAAEWTAQQNFNESAITSTSNVTAWDLDVAQTAYHNMTENTTIDTPTNMNAGGTYIIRIEGDGASTLAWEAEFEWGTASAPAAPAADGDVIIVSFYSDGSTMYGVESVRVEA